ncbi:MAG: MarR family transcriptional regulator [Planctomycetes bacterium]|nr:MarR family transcriptional regulator [Planctomycetota bacterium]
MKIAEMESHHDRFTASESVIAKMLANREFPAVFSACEGTFPHIVPAIQFRKKRSIDPETPRLGSFRVVLKYAPPLFEHNVIQSLYDLVSSARLLAKHENNYLDQVTEALGREEVARILWNHLGRHPGFLQSDIRKELGVVQDSAVEVVKAWEELGLIVRDQEKNSYRLYLRSRLDDPAEGICHHCGVRGKGRKDLFFEPIVCGRCGTKGYYHIVCKDHH